MSDEIKPNKIGYVERTYVNDVPVTDDKPVDAPMQRPERLAEMVEGPAWDYIQALERQVYEMTKDNPAARALDGLWHDIVRKRHPLCGNWKTPAHAAIRILAAFAAVEVDAATERYRTLMKASEGDDGNL